MQADVDADKEVLDEAFEGSVEVLIAYVRRGKLVFDLSQDYRSNVVLADKRDCVWIVLGAWKIVCWFDFDFNIL